MSGNEMETIDRSGARWAISGRPDIELAGRTRDTTAQFGLDRPNIWTEGGETFRVTIRLEAFVPIGAQPPDIEEIQRRILAALTPT